MKATGIVRRIDELGRVVIPKEIRKTLRIQVGDPLEIYTEKEELIIKKYSPIASLERESLSLASALAEISERICMITDKDRMLAVSGIKYKEHIGKEITEDLAKIIKERKSALINLEEGGKLIALIKNEALEISGEVVVPIISNSESIGAVILLNKTGKPVDADDVKIATLGALILAKQFI